MRCPTATLPLRVPLSIDEVADCYFYFFQLGQSNNSSLSFWPGSSVIQMSPIQASKARMTFSLGQQTKLTSTMYFIRPYSPTSSPAIRRTTSTVLWVWSRRQRASPRLNSAARKKSWLRGSRCTMLEGEGSRQSSQSRLLSRKALGLLWMSRMALSLASLYILNLSNLSRCSRQYRFLTVKPSDDSSTTMMQLGAKKIRRKPSITSKCPCLQVIADLSSYSTDIFDPSFFSEYPLTNCSSTRLGLKCRKGWLAYSSAYTLKHFSNGTDNSCSWFTNRAAESRCLEGTSLTGCGAPGRQRRQNRTRTRGMAISFQIFDFGLQKLGEGRRSAHSNKYLRICDLSLQQVPGQTTLVSIIPRIYEMNEQSKDSPHREREVELRRKMKLLKEEVRQQRDENCKLEDELHHLYEEIRRRQTEGKKRDDKNESLLLEIRVLRDILISEKNEREALENRLEGPPSRPLENGYSGLRNFFR